MYNVKINVKIKGYARAVVIVALIAVFARAFNIEQIDPDAEQPSNNIITNIDGVEMPFGDGVGDYDGDYYAPSPPSVPSSTPSTQSTPTSTPQSPEAPAVRRPATQRDLDAMSREELFQLAFGGSAVARPRNLMLNLIAEGRSLGVAEVVFSADFSSFDFISPAFSRFLDAQIVPEARAEAGDSVGYFNSRVLTAAGYRAQAYDLMHELHVTLPPEKKAVSRLNLKGGFAYEPRGELVKAAFSSFYVNYTLSNAINYSDGFYNIGGQQLRPGGYMRTPANLSLDGAASMFNWALEGTASLREPNDGQPWTWDLYRRGNVRLVRDVIPWHSRFMIGDIGLVMGSGMVGGMRYEYNKGLFGNNPQDEESSIEFFMPRAGDVEVFIDGVYRQRFFLPAGLHEVRGFGGEMGRNSARLVLRFVDGSFEEIPFEYVLGHPRNLGRGGLRLTAASGFRRVSAPSPACYDYVPEEPAASVDILYGITRRVSGGIGGIVSRHNNVGRASASIDMGAAGHMGVSGGANYAPGAEVPLGHRADVSYTPNLSPGIRRINRRLGGDASGRGLLPYFGLSARGYYQSERYNANPFTETSPFNSSVAGISGGLGFGLLRGGLSFGGGVNFYRETEANAANFYPMGYNYHARLSQTIMRVPISASAGEYVLGPTRSPFFSVTMSHGFGVGAGLGGSIGRHRFSAGAGIGTGMAYAPLVLRPGIDVETGEIVYEIVPDDRVGLSMGGSANFGWRYSNFGAGVGARSYSATAIAPNIFDPKIPGLSATLAHTYNRANLSANYSLSRQNTSFMDMTSHRLNASLTGSFMFADGLWAFGRQTGGGFLLADARYNLKGANVHMDRSHHQMRDLSRNGWLGAAYKGNVSAYSHTMATITLTDAPPGAFLQNNLFYTEGGYKRGHALRLGSKDGITIQARFASLGKPLSYAYVTVEREDGKGAPRATFTGGDGILQMGEMAAGITYRIKFAQGSNIKDVLITIPKNAGPLFEPEVVEVDRAAAE